MSNVAITAEDLETVALGVPIVIGLVQVAKHSGLSDRYAPMFAIVVAFGVGLVLLDDPTSPSGLLICLLMGLSASGLYDHGATLAAALKAKKDTTDATTV